MGELTQQNGIAIPLSKGYVAIIDPCDADLQDYKWSVREYSRTQYAVHAVCKRGDTSYWRLHRIVLARALGRELNPHEYVDHINSNGLDNRRSNLRLATNAENLRNQQKREGCVSHFKGVTFDKKRNRWRAKICVNYHYAHLGWFLTQEAAAHAYNEAAIKYHDEFARLNELPQE